MKSNAYKQLVIIGLLLILISGYNLNGQDSTALKSQMLDVKLQLLDSKLDLLDTKIKLWEAKPKELDNRLNEISNKVNSMDFDPQMMTRKINEIDSLVNLPRTEIVYASEEPRPVSEPGIPVFAPAFKSAIMLDPVRLMEGTFYLSYERIISPTFSYNIGGMATYSTSQGISNYYFTNQYFAAYDASTKEYYTYSGEVMSGAGLNLQLRNYLMANHPGRKKAPFGLYAAPQLMYRRINIKGNHQEMVEVETDEWEWQTVEVTQRLNIYAGGVILGFKLPLFNALAIDIFAGGNIKLSGYTNEHGFTRYKDWFNIDFSGVSPVAGIAIGILK
jgi:hypothetical protein